MATSNESTMFNSESSGGDDTCAQLRTRASRLLSAENVYKTRIEVLQRQLSELQSSLESITPSTQSIVKQVARLESLELTEQVMTKLPREIRDMIYFHLGTRHDEHVEREHYRTTRDPLTKLFSYNYERWKAEHFPEHYWTKENVAEHFYQELVESYYRTSTFVFADDPAIMQRFLTTDEMKLGLLPKDLVSNVEIRLHSVARNRGSWRAYMQFEPNTSEQMRGGLDGMFDLREGANVVVRLVTEAKTEEERIERCEKATAMIFDGEQVERMKAYKVKLVLDDGREWGLGDKMREPRRMTCR